VGIGGDVLENLFQFSEKFCYNEKSFSHSSPPKKMKIEIYPLNQK